MTPKHILHTSSGDLGLAFPLPLLLLLLLPLPLPLLLLHFGLAFLLPFPLSLLLAFGLPPIFLFLRVLLELFAILYNMCIIYILFIVVVWYYLQICLVSLTSKPFLYSKYISASGYSVIDKLNGPLSKKTYVCVVFD